MEIKPSFIARKGSLIVCALLILLLAVGALIRYPETVDTIAFLRAANAPKPVWVYQSGKLLSLLKSDGDKVTAGEIIGCMETTADWTQVLKLSEDLDSLCSVLDRGDTTRIFYIMDRNRSRLGELQSDYQAFMEDYFAFENFTLAGYAGKRLSLLQKDLAFISRSRSLIDTQASLYKQDADLTHASLESNGELLAENVISEQEYRQLLSQDIGKKMTIPQVQGSYLNTDIQKHEKAKEILELNNQMHLKWISFRQAAFRFKSSTVNWKRNYLLVASTSGSLSFPGFIQEKQVIQAGKPLCYVVPDNNNFYMQALIPQTNLGKVEIGQEVLLRFDGWQYQEYGTVRGSVAYISNISTDSGYMTKIALPSGLSTTVHKQLAYREGLSARAFIVTKDISLINRLYYSIVRAGKN